MKLNVSLLFLLLFILFPAHAQDSVFLKKKEKSFLVEDRSWSLSLPVWAPGFRGKFSYGNFTLEGEGGKEPGEEIGNIFSRLFSSKTSLEFYFIMGAEFRKNRFNIAADAFSGTVGTSVKFDLNNKEIVQVSVRFITSRIYAGYNVLEAMNRSGTLKFSLEVLAGVRFLDVDVFSRLNQLEKFDVHKFWAEPLAGIQNRLALERWLFILHADFGGFRLNGKLSHTINLIINYRTGGLTSIRFGWTDLDINHKSVLHEKDLNINVHLSGPMLGINFHF